MAALSTTIVTRPAYGFHEGGGGGCGGDCKSPPKYSKIFAKYQDHPGKDGQSCADCIFFIRTRADGQMDHCHLVSGEIGPHGWCRLFVRQQPAQCYGNRC
ncbi:high-potential iron-sulfur protein [Acidithiobacillus sulfuriphilus]|uniref:high-potential iron-sulfur protein n=1 Tax=Acidithiobacillus sulfuriphilus TaxID=1867749 RepID=UPI003F618AB2